MKVYITGGAGMIGQAAARAHLAAGHEVWIYDDQSNPWVDQAAAVGHRSSDLSDIVKLKPDLVSVHGALVSAYQSQVDMATYLLRNCDHVAEVLGWIRRADTGMVIYAGSMGPYGEGVYQCSWCETEEWIERHTQPRDPMCRVCGAAMTPKPMAEELRPKPLNQYAVSKAAGEEMLRVLAESDRNRRVVSLRYFSVYGSRSPIENRGTGVLSVIGRMLVEDPEVRLNEDGNQSRDLVHEDDCGEAHLHFSRWMSRSTAPKFAAFNIGTGHRWTVIRVAEMMQRHLQTNKPVLCNGQVRSGDTRHAVARTTLASLEGWQAMRKLADKLPEYCEWVKKEYGKRKT